jgi:NAD(P)-dependent dehydrogenase (short-subunit alcohol dehydrogenase family)
MPAYTEESTATEVASALSTNISGKVILITGASPNSLAETAALAIAAHNPALIIIHGRSKVSLQETEKKLLAKNASVKTRILICDLASFASVRKGAAEVNSYPESIDVIINSAGIMAVPFSKTIDGIESHFAVNHLAPFLLTNLIVGHLAKNARILNVTSGAYAFGGVRFDDINFEVRATRLMVIYRLTIIRLTHTTNGKHTHSRSQPTYFIRLHWQSDLDQRESFRTPSISEVVC